MIVPFGEVALWILGKLGCVGWDEQRDRNVYLQDVL
jgi:hypothetical protein